MRAKSAAPLAREARSDPSESSFSNNGASPCESGDVAVKAASGWRCPQRTPVASSGPTISIGTPIQQYSESLLGKCVRYTRVMVPENA